MKAMKILDQDIAVFGPSGSGKTVLLSSFFGLSQEKEFEKSSRYMVVPENPGQGARLHQDYLGMKQRAEVPVHNKFRGDTYRFILKLRSAAAGKAAAHKFDQLRLNWHDYPGEWFDQEVSGDSEKVNRLEVFQALLGSDVALLLVDGQKILENAGQEQKYLKLLFTQYKNMLALLQEDLTANGKIEEFPRIWIIALAKADLLPGLDAFALRELVNGAAASEVEGLRQILREIVDSPDALSVGEDFLILSSAKFEADQIDFKQTKGLNLILPLAGILPIERFIRWAEAKKISWKTAEAILGGAQGFLATVAPMLLLRLPNKFRLVAVPILPLLSDLARMGKDQLVKAFHAAIENGDEWTAILAGWRLDLVKAQEVDIFLPGQ